jgi:hypothetical protein
MRADVLEPQRLRVVDEKAQHPAPARQGADLLPPLGFDPDGQELLELLLPLVQDAESRVTRARELAGDVEHPVEHDLQVELGDERSTHFHEAGQSLVAQVVAAGWPFHRRPI